MSSPALVRKDQELGGEKQSPPTIVRDLSELLAAGSVFPTIYADPPWSYRNRSSRAAAESEGRAEHRAGDDPRLVKPDQPADDQIRDHPRSRETH